MNQSNEMNLTVIGTGYVGLTTGLGFAELGNRVICVDIDKKKIKDLKKDIIPIHEKGMEELLKRNRAKLSFTTNIKEAVKKSQVIFIAVGTPARDTGEADLSQIIDVAQNLRDAIDSYKLIVIKSTVPVGSVELIKDILSRKKREGKDFDLVVNPEFLREGDAVYDFLHPSRIVIGTDSKQAAETLSKLYKPLNSPILITSPIDAQMIKYAANAFLASRISFINEIATIAERVGADIKNIVKGLSYDKRLGDGYLSPGIGFGGPCLIKDLKALISIAQSRDYEPRYLKSILDKNEEQMKSIVIKVKKALGGILYGRTLGVLGLSFKPYTKDVRNSLAIKIIELLKLEGARIKAYDPIAIKQAKELISDIEYLEDPYDLKEIDLLLILVGYKEFKDLDYKKIKRGMTNPIIIDGVNILSLEDIKPLGFQYIGVGR